MSDLPEGWAHVPLEIVGTWGSGGTPTRTNDQYYAKEGIPWLVIGDLNDRVVLKSSNFITELGLINSSAKLVPAGTLLVAMYGSIGKLGITGIECATNQAIAFCKPNESIVSLRYLYRAMFNAKPNLLALGQGGAQQNISQSVLKEFEIPLAPKNEQARIANQLDTLLTRIQSCNERFDAIPALLKRFRQTVYAAATLGPWEATTIGAISVDLRYGTSKKCDYAATGIGVLRIPNIAERGRIDVVDLKRAEFDISEIQKLKLVDGDLLVIRSNGSVELVGKTGLVTADESGLLFAGYLMRLRVDSTKAIPAFVQLCLSAPLQRQYIERTAKSTSGVNNLNAEELRSVPLPLPPLTEQAEIVRHVKALFALADRIEARATAAHAHAQRLSPLVLARAFRGELVPQDPQDEPASALLERIAAQRAMPAEEKQTKKPRQARTPRAPKEAAAMTKSRQDDDVKDKPYLADHLRCVGGATTAEVLFKASELPVADFYKQLAWEVAQGHIADGGTTLEARHAAG
jgi:type I restriction enzyme S subunit